jgi:hypothetical protein
MVGAVGGGGGGPLLVRVSSSFFCVFRNALMKSALSSSWSSPIPIALSSFRSSGSMLAIKESRLDDVVVVGEFIIRGRPCAGGGSFELL